jgi:FAD/FMN-containing dehydrogenase
MDLIQRLQAIVGAGYVTEEGPDSAFLTDIRRIFHGRVLARVIPGTPQEVAAVVRECVRSRTPIVVQGGNTGLMGAATPDDSGRSILLQLSRLNRIRQIDPDNDTITVEAGCILQQVQEAAAAAGRLFPLSLGAQGSCTLGGNLGTNAGGTQVLRYGNTRELTLGLEVVTAEGEIWHGLRGLRKDNTGYDLRDLYIGSEGTLGIITAATLKLYPRPAAYCAGWLQLASLPAAVALLRQARREFGPALTGFEVISNAAVLQIARFTPDVRLPLAAEAGEHWHVLLELSDGESAEHGQALFERVVGDAFTSGLVQDAVLAQSEAQRLAMWHVRENAISEAQAAEGVNIKHDISVPISRIAAFIAATDALLAEHYPGIRTIPFGHLGDGNLHYNVSPPHGTAAADFLLHEDHIHQLVHDSAYLHGGSISAEHGIGQVKRDVLPRYKSALELGLMQRIKQALDPLNILNPGKVLNTGTAAVTVTRPLGQEAA